MSIFRRPKVKPPLLVEVPDDIEEARALRGANSAELAVVKAQEPIIFRLANALIERRGENHYIELLYSYTEKQA